jgi:uncharacterized protein YyaL (SSP411 family)
VTNTLDYLLSPPMRISGAGFASAEDADSEGVEGRFYVWSEAEIVEVGGRAAAEWYGAARGGNWEGSNILCRPPGAPLARPADIETARAALLARRATRVRPGLDDKVLTEWNAMAVAALAEAGAALDRPDWIAAAEQVARFLLDALRRGSDGRWMRSWQGVAGSPPTGSARHLAYAADHAWLIEAFTRLAEATGRAHWLTHAREAADSLIRLFGDPSSGAFLTTGHDAEQLIARPVDIQDGALPSANSVAASALLRLSALTGEQSYASRATEVIDSMRPALEAAPIALTGIVAAAELAASGVVEVVVTGDRPDLLEVVRERYLPGAVLAWGEPTGSPLWEGRTDPKYANLAFVCRHFACEAPTSEPGELAAQLSV